MQLGLLLQCDVGSVAVPVEMRFRRLAPDTATEPINLANGGRARTNSVGGSRVVARCSPRPVDGPCRVCLAPLSCPEPFGERLQEVPSDGGVVLHQGAELPERQAVTRDVTGGGDRCRSCALIDQGGLTEVITS